MYEVYNRDPRVIGEYTEPEHAKKALKNMPLAAVVVKDGEVLAYKQSLSIREQARIRDAITEEYEAATRPPAIEPQQVEEPKTSSHDDPADSSSPSYATYSSRDQDNECDGDYHSEQSALLPDDASVTVSTPPAAPLKCTKCNKPALRITPMMRPEHHGLCKNCRDRAYERARSKPKSPTKNAALPPPSDIAEHIDSRIALYGSLILQAIGNQLTGEQREILQLGEIIGLETLRVLAARVQK